MAIDNLDALLNLLENPRRFSKKERSDARQTLLEHPADVVPQLHIRLRQWLEIMQRTEVRGIDQQCQEEVQGLAGRLGSVNHPAFLSEAAQLDCVRFRNSLEIREAAAIAMLDVLGEIGDPESVPLFKEVLHGPWRNDMTWFTAAAGLIRSGDSDGAAYMKERILDPATSPGMRRGCCRKLVELGVTGILSPQDTFPVDSAEAAVLEAEYGSVLRRDSGSTNTSSRL